MHIPRLVLHHYTSGVALLGVLDSGQLWASSIHHLNDAKEFSHAIDVARNALARAASRGTGPIVEELWRSVESHVQAMSKVGVYVACFSTVEDSLSQWRGYCPPAFGYSLGFNGDELRRVAEQQGFKLDRCIYERDEQDLLVDEWAARTLSELQQQLPLGTPDVAAFVRANCKGFMQEFAKTAPFLKHAAFRDEKEWRLAGLISSNDKRIKVRPGRSMLIPYVPIDLQLCQENSPIWNVVVGPTPHPELAMDAVSLYFDKVRIQNGVTRSQSPYRDW